MLGLGDIGPAGGDAGDGGQGGAVQGVRRRRRVADLPRHEGHGRDRRSVAGDRARLRRHQPRGHLRAALLRDRGPAAGVARHPGLPRRPARHGDRRARGVAERAPSRRQARRGRAHRHHRLRRRRDGRARDMLQRAGARRIVGCDRRARSLFRGRPDLDPCEAGVRGDGRTRDESDRHRGRGCSPARTSSSGSPCPGAVSRRGSRGDGGPRDRVRDGEPDARGRPGGDRGARRGRRDRTLRLPEPDQQRARVPRRLPRRARRLRPDDQRGDGARGGAGDRGGRSSRRRARRPSTSCRASSTAPSRPRSPRPLPPPPSRAASPAAPTDFRRLPPPHFRSSPQRPSAACPMPTRPGERSIRPWPP